MKKLLLGIAMLLMAGSSFATDGLTLTLQKPDLKLGDVTDVDLSITVSEDYLEVFTGFQLRVLVPVGIEFQKMGGSNKNPLYYSITSPSMQEIGVTITQKFYPITSEDNKTGYNELRLIATSLGAVPFLYDTTEPLVKMRIKVTDRAFTSNGEYGDSILNKVMVCGIPGKNGAQPIVFTDGISGVNYPDVDAEFNYSLDYTIGETGYSTLCWPVALDFTNNDFKASIGSDITGETYMTRTQVTKVPAGCPVIIQGEPGDYTLTTTLDDPDDVSGNVLEGTAYATLPVEDQTIYALAKKEAGVGFYKGEKGVEIPLYKAYYTGNGAAVDGFIFEETSGISQMTADEAAGNTYTISGVKVEKAAQKGIYIVNGKKVVVK